MHTGSGFLNFTPHIFYLEGMIFSPESCQHVIWGLQGLPAIHIPTALPPISRQEAKDWL